MKTKRKKMQFTDKEKKVLELISYGWTTNEISDQIKVSYANVQATIRRMLDKSDSANRTLLVRYGFEHGYLK